jgi:acyl-CoA thioesterase
MSGTRKIRQWLQDADAHRGMDSLLTHLGICGAPEWNEVGAVIRLTLRQIHMNGGASAHGGLVATLLDAVMACSSATPEETRSCVTVEMKVNYMRPGGAVGTVLTAQGELKACSRTLAFCEGEIRNEAGELLATGSGTFKYLAHSPMTL